MERRNDTNPGLELGVELFVRSSRRLGVMAIGLIDRVRARLPQAENQPDLVDAIPGESPEIGISRDTTEPRDSSLVTAERRLAEIGDPRFTGRADRRKPGSPSDRRREGPIRGRWKMHRNIIKGEVVFLSDERPKYDRRNSRQRDRRKPPLDTN